MRTRTLLFLLPYLLLPLSAHAQGTFSTPALVVQTGELMQCSLLNQEATSVLGATIVMRRGGDGSVVLDSTPNDLPQGRGFAIQTGNPGAPEVRYCEFSFPSGPCDNVLTSSCTAGGGCVAGELVTCTAPESRAYVTGVVQPQRYGDVVCAVSNTSGETVVATPSLVGPDGTLVTRVLRIGTPKGFRGPRNPPV
jgi:hypothetical protein